MSLWIIFALIALGVSAALLFPLLRSRTGSSEAADYDIQVYQSQLAELEQAETAHQLSEASAAAARTEISRRILAADRRRSGAQAAPVASEARPRRTARLLLAGGIALAVPAGSVLLYLQLGSPGLPNQPFAERVAAARNQGGQPGGPATEIEMAGLVEQLVQRLEREPGNLDGWILLGRSLLQLGRLAEAAEAFGTAAKLAPDDAQLQAGYGEAVIMAQDGMVTPAARAAFDKSLELDPKNPRARYYQGLARLQEGDAQGALDGWLALAGDTPADAPWRETLSARIREARTQLGLDPEAEVPVASGPAAIPGARPGGTTPGPSAEDVAAAETMPAEERQALVQSMVARLAERLEENPEDLSGWLMLARSYNQLGQPEAERDALAKAAALEPENPEILAMYGRAIRVTAGNRQTEDSLAVMRRLLAVDKSNMQALWFVAMAEARAGRKDEARALFDRALAQVPPDSPERTELEARVDILLTGTP